MNKTTLRQVNAEVRRKQKEVHRLREELENLQDLLDLLAARSGDDGKRYSLADARQKLKLA